MLQNTVKMGTEQEKMKDCENKLRIVAILFTEELISKNGRVREKTSDALIEAKIEYIKQEIDIGQLPIEEKCQLKSEKEIIIRRIAYDFKQFMRLNGRLLD